MPTINDVPKVIRSCSDSVAQVKRKQQMNFLGTHSIKVRFQGVLILVVVLVTTPGCTICCQPYLDDYVAFGSRTPRSDMKNGRVGSPFSDPNIQGTVIASEPDSGLYYEEDLPTEEYAEEYSEMPIER